MGATFRIAEGIHADRLLDRNSLDPLFSSAPSRIPSVILHGGGEVGTLDP